MFIVHVYRPETVKEIKISLNLDSDTRLLNPFEGHEILGVCEDEDQVNALIDEYEDRGWEFQYEELRIPEGFPVSALM